MCHFIIKRQTLNPGSSKSKSKKSKKILRHLGAWHRPFRARFAAEPHHCSRIGWPFGFCQQHSRTNWLLFFYTCGCSTTLPGEQTWHGELTTRTPPTGRRSKIGSRSSPPAETKDDTLPRFHCAEVIATLRKCGKREQQIITRLFDELAQDPCYGVPNWKRPRPCRAKRSVASF